MNKCLVTGASGFIGSRLLVRLQQSGFPVRVLLRNSRQGLASAADTVIGDLSDSRFDFAALTSGVETVFHLAATAHTSATAEQYRHDCEQTIRLAKAAEIAGVRHFVLVSSTRAMAASGNTRRDESWLPWPDDSYGYWKRMTEERLLAESRLPYLAIVRPAMVYGAGMKGNLVQMILAIRTGYFPPLPSLPNERSMVSVDDLVDAILLVAKNPDTNRQPLIVSDGVDYTARTLYLAIMESLGRKVPAWELPVWCFNLLGLLGDLAGLAWPHCPFSTARIQGLLAPAAFSADKLRSVGWAPSTDFYRELPSILAALEDAS